MQTVNWFSNFFLGFELNCPGKMWHVTNKWMRLLFWLPTWLSIIIVAPVRFVMLIFYFFYVTFVQVIAAISDFFIGIKNWFDNLFFGSFYYSIKLFEEEKISVDTS